MTKTDIIKGIKDTRNEIFERRCTDDSLQELQELCQQYGDGNKWCCYEKCLTEIIKGGNEKAIDKAMDAFERFFKIQGEMNAIYRLEDKVQI